MPELHRHQLRGGPGGLPRRHRRRLGQQERRHRRDRRRRRLRSVRPLYPGLRARRQVGQARHQDCHRVGLRASDFVKGFCGPGRRHRRSVTSSSPRTRASTSSSRSPATPATASSTPPARPASTPSASTSTSTSPMRPRRPCILTSAEKKLAVSVSTVDPADQRQDRQGRPRLLQRDERRHRRLALLRGGEQAAGRHPDQDRRRDRGMKAGSVVTCPPAPPAARPPLQPIGN